MGMNRLYQITSVVAAGRDVPRAKRGQRGRTTDRYRRLARLAAEDRPTFITFTECWNEEAVKGIREGLPPGYGLRRLLKNSALLAYDARVVQIRRNRLGKRRTINVFLHRGLRGVTDTRWAVGAIFTHRATKREIMKLAYHCTPRRRDLGQTVYAKTGRMQARAEGRVNKRMHGSYYPSACSGDFNTRRPRIGDRSKGDGIIRVANDDGFYAKFGPMTQRTIPAPVGFDHDLLHTSVWLRGE